MDFRQAPSGARLRRFTKREIEEAPEEHRLNSVEKKLIAFLLENEGKRLSIDRIGMEMGHGEPRSTYALIARSVKRGIIEVRFSGRKGMRYYTVTRPYVNLVRAQSHDRPVVRVGERVFGPQPERREPQQPVIVPVKTPNKSQGAVADMVKQYIYSCFEENKEPDLRGFVEWLGR